MHSGVSLCAEEFKDGPGDSGLGTSAPRSRRLSTTGARGAPHISQCVSEGWFSRVHRGQDTIPLDVSFVSGNPFFVSFCGRGGGLLDIAAMAALTTSTVGGLIPQARHGGMGVREAREGSKFEGTGFENEQIGHTHVALCWGAAGAGLAWRGGVPAAEATGAGEPRESCLIGLGYSVILAEDLRKPACHRVNVGSRDRGANVRRTRASQHPSGRWPLSSCGAHYGRHSTRDATLGRLDHFGTVVSWTCYAQPLAAPTCEHRNGRIPLVEPHSILYKK
jgi:hypothetical protein